MLGPHFRRDSLPRGADAPLRAAWADAQKARENVLREIATSNRIPLARLIELDEAKADRDAATSKVAEIRAELDPPKPPPQEARAGWAATDAALTREIARFQVRHFPKHLQDEAAAAIVEISQLATARIRRETEPLDNLMSAEMSRFVDHLAAANEEDRQAITRAFNRARARHSRERRAKEATVVAHYEAVLKARLAAIHDSAREKSR
jgi:hypothetical protein